MHTSYWMPLAWMPLAGLALISAACGSGDAPPASLDTDDQKASYAIGRQMATSLEPARSRLDLAAFQQGLEDALGERESSVPEEELQAALRTFQDQIREEQLREFEESGARNKTEGDAYLEANGAKEGVTTTESGLQYEVLRGGDGPRPNADDRVTIHYKGTLIDGTEFDNSYGRGQPATFSVGGVIPGFSEGLQLMPVGSQYRFTIPSELGYGLQGAGGDIGPNATLIFEVELLEIAP